MSMHDGINRLWILRTGGGLDVEGHKDNLSAIDALIRHALAFGAPDMKARIEAAVAEAIKHMDPKPDEDTEEPDDAEG